MKKFDIHAPKKLTVEDSCRLFRAIGETVGGKPIMDKKTREDIIQFSELYTPGSDWTAQIAFEFDFEEAMAGTKSRDKAAAYEAWVAIYQAAVGLYPKAHLCQKSKNYVERNFDFELTKSMAESEDEDNRKIAGWVIISQQAKKNQDAKKYFLEHYLKLTEGDKSKIKNVLACKSPTPQSRPRP